MAARRPSGRPGRWAVAFPGIVALQAYPRQWLRGDSLERVTVAAYLIPEVSVDNLGGPPEGLASSR